MSFYVSLVSLGCSKNLVDSEVMVNILSNNKYKMTDDVNKADIIIVNTCGFIESAKQESIDSILDMGQLKESGGCKVLIASGCMAERYKDELMKEMPELDAVIGTGDYKNILEVIEQALAGNKVVKYGNQEAIDIDELPRTLSGLGVSAYLKIAEGCDNRCTYCIIPQLRGRFRSRSFENIIKEANMLAANGIKELNIIAQDTTKYGIDLYGRYRIAELLAELSKIDGIQWIRLLYSYPDAFSDELINIIAENDKLCKYLDIPVQHASNKILKKMNRKSSKEAIELLIKKLRGRIPDISLRTSLIVGFPGESREDFEELYEFVKNTRFDRLGVFTYSREEETPAYKLTEQLDEDTKLERQNRIMELQQRISLENNMNLVGRTLKVLIEGMEDNRYIGRSYKDAPEIDGIVYVSSKRNLLPGEFYFVRITEAYEYDLMGEIADELSQ
ncbi:MAG: 30S ribosomal protein S12 methylthiotransferase RimO [Bacillota bacterium]